MDESPLFLGVDGGGTLCRARLCGFSGDSLGEGSAGPANIRFGVEESFASILEATRRCFAKAGLPFEAVKRTTACLALAGASEPSYLLAAREYKHPFQNMIVTTDAHAACVGAHGDRDGGIIVVGTGTIGWGQLHGRQHRVGGWGFPVSDEGSGAWLGCEAMRRVLWACDGRIEWTGVLKAIFADFNSDPHAIVRWMTKAGPRDFARHTHVIVEHAALKDPLACELMRLAAGHIDALALRLRSFGISRIALVGGLAASIEPWLAREIRQHLVRPEGDALHGALHIAAAEVKSAAVAD